MILLVVLRPTSRSFYILVADGMHDLDEIIVQMNGVEKYYYC